MNAPAHPELENILSLVERWEHHFTGAYLQLVATMRDAEWDLSVCKIIFCNSPMKPVEFTYPTFRYIAEWLSVADAADRICQAIGDSHTLSADDLILPCTGRFDMFPGREIDGIQQRMVSHARPWLPLHEGWPFYLFHFGLERRNNPPSGDLRASGQPYYPSGHHLIRDLLGFDSATIFDSGITICVPQFRARIDTISTTRSGFHIDVGPSGHPLDDLVLQYYVRMMAEERAVLIQRHSEPARL